MLNQPFIKFIMVGGFAALVNFLSRIAFNQISTFRQAVVYAYLVGMLTAYVLSKVFVFEPSGRHPAAELFWFSIVNIFAIIQVWIISVGLAEYVFPKMHIEFYPEAIAHFIGLGVPVITSYFGHKYFSFKKV